MQTPAVGSYLGHRFLSFRVPAMINFFYVAVVSGRKQAARMKQIVLTAQLSFLCRIKKKKNR